VSQSDAAFVRQSPTLPRRHHVPKCVRRISANCEPSGRQEGTGETEGETSRQGRRNAQRAGIHRAPRFTRAV
jgi:hypothetical protein